jgi:hypothetical protein
MGNFPRLSMDTVMALGDVEDAQGRELEPSIPTPQGEAVVGCDVARFGSDETVIATRHGARVRIVERYVGKPTTHTAGRVAFWSGQLRAESSSFPIVVIDDIGVGGGVTDQLRAEGHHVVGFNASHAPFRPTKFPNRRSELWFEMADRLGELDLDPDEQLAADLTGPRYSYDARMRQVVEAKAETKKRLGRSPDRADACLLTLAAGTWGDATAALAHGDEFAAWTARVAAERANALSATPFEDWAAGLARDESDRWRGLGLPDF